jgi:hypothetical protein
MSARDGISHDGERDRYIVTLGGVERGSFETRGQALRALENGTGYVLGEPGRRPRTGPAALSSAARALEAPDTPEVARAASQCSDVAAVKAGKDDPPETVRQAQAWDSACAWYGGAGLCGRCASQMAWGHQIGWGRVHPPCDECEATVATFPVPKVNGWRSVPQKSRRNRASWPV